VLFSAPAAHIRANLRNQLQHPIGTDAVDLAERVVGGLILMLHRITGGADLRGARSSTIARRQVAVASTKHHNVTGRAEAGVQQTYTMKFLQPLAVFDIGLAPAHVVHVMSIDQHHLQPAPLPALRERESNRPRSTPLPPS
jgi:hypothetical protein